MPAMQPRISRLPVAPARVAPRADEISNEALMSSYLRGDVPSFNQLFTRLAPAVHSFFVSSFRDRSVADDLLQTTFLKFHRARTEYNPELEVRPWLFTIAARVRLDELRRRHHAPPTTSEEELAQLVDGEDGVPRTAEELTAQKDRDHAVRSALLRLPENQRVVLHLHRYERMTFVEIAGVLGVAVPTVKSRAFLAYELLRKELRPLVSDEGAS
jgi:RNA polymerase sigma-70 factor (ECF subfamily)